METRFYCEKCGNDVAFNTEVCPYCGESFDAVKCPVCKLIGKPALFVGGCPSCGFQNPRQDIASARPLTFPGKKAQQKERALQRRKKSPPRFIIPVFWYRIMIAVFLIILIGLIYLLFRLY